MCFSVQSGSPNFKEQETLITDWNLTCGHGKALFSMPVQSYQGPRMGCCKSASHCTILSFNTFRFHTSKGALYLYKLQHVEHERVSLAERQHASAICRRIPYRSNHKLFNCLLWYCPRGTEWLTCDNQYCQQCSWTYKLLCCLTMTWIVFYRRAIEGINHVDALFNQKENVWYTVSLFEEKWEVNL